MYRCCTCHTGVSPMRATVASPSFPHTCSACGTEQHRPANSLSRVLVYWTGGVLYIALLGWTAFNLESWSVVAGGFAALIALAIGVEAHWYRVGRLVPTTPDRKRVERTVMAAILGPLAIAVIAMELRARWQP